VSGTVLDASVRSYRERPSRSRMRQRETARTSTTDGRGDFLFAALRPGSYTMKVELTGFRTLERRGNVLDRTDLEPGQPEARGGAVSEVLTVEVQGTKVETTETAHTALDLGRQLQQSRRRAATSRTCCG